MIRKSTCKKGCIYYNWHDKKCDYPNDKCILEESPPEKHPNNNLATQQ